MNKIARNGDSVTFPNGSTGKIVSYSSNHNADNLGIARNGDIVEYQCTTHGTKEIGNIVSTSSHIVDGRPIAKVGDKVSYCEGFGTIVGGSGNHNTN